MDTIHLIHCSINLFNLHSSRRRIQQCINWDNHDCLRSAHMGIRDLPPVDKEKINSRANIWEETFFLNFAKQPVFFGLAKIFPQDPPKSALLLIIGERRQKMF